MGEIEKQLDKEIKAIYGQLQKKNRIVFSNQRVVRTYSDFLRDKGAMISVIQDGIPYRLFTLIRQMAPFSEYHWSIVLDLSSKSLKRYEQQRKSFKPIQSEKIIEISEVTQMGLDTFGDVDRFKKWLETPTIALGNVKPIELLKNSYGKDLVLGELNRINHGILS